MPSAPGFDPYGDLFELLGLAAHPCELEADAVRLREIRRKLVWAYSWAVPCLSAVQEIASHGPLIEIGAGTGYWAWLIQQAGADIVAFDRAPQAPPIWTRVLDGGPERVSEQPERTLFLCWPPIGEPLAAECLERYGGAVLLSIGEKGSESAGGESPRTGDARFRTLLSERFTEEREIALPRWPGYKDSLTVYRRKS